MEKVVTRQLFRNLERFEHQSIELNGWVRNNRAQKSFGFLMINDGSFFETIQVVYEESLDNFKEIQKIRVGSAVTVYGVVIPTPNAKQPFEIKAHKLVLKGDCPEDYPIQPKRHTREFLREVAHLRPRTNLFSAVFRVRSLVAFAIHSYFQEKNFVYVHTPIITGSDAEGAGEMFRVTTLDLDNIPRNEEGVVDFKHDFFAKSTNLTVSGQLEGEAFALALRDVYTFGPTFRAENSNTQRHASEFWMIEPEMAFADLKDDMDMAEGMIKYIINYVLENAPEEMNFFDQYVSKGVLNRVQTVANSTFKRITYTEAIDILLTANKKFENKVEWGIDLSTEHERYLTDEVFKSPVFVTDYPKDIKAFYMRVNDDQKTVAAMDLLVPGVGELIGGSQREERLDILEKRMEEIGVPTEDLNWYLDLRRYGGVTHSGFGLGFERMVMYLTGVENIRDVIPFPRTPKNAEF
ncbi:MAG: asparagine--tRNA ligase [Turicibacter sp.]|uniref:Asparagine--tRNA ligase n=1 Tax=Turicibacter faecis TaxID=2963365 RepID=A0ABM8IQH5_9FIRM|nr:MULTISPECIES: asparagine--tRNA ligase [unclassified Turicibacter]MCI8702436.1 asparagine--tRNA ligase [Turicibacter sp.]BEH92077.1 asparagine--tRNA ligase [Turicibacter sp. TC023]MCU7205402.1 asparagine--tRNA ligase [Turicibacter sp. TA25]MCU7209568.1 asparagine--tRNA ligase [Turicibacter sp. 1E2]NCE77994.1 asparagine--tRNA ligase [Turicibacter sp. TS3]